MPRARPRGTIVMKTTVARHDQIKAADLAPLVINEINLIGSRCGPFSEAISALSSESIDVLSLISRRVKLTDAVEALKTAAKSDVIKVLLEP